ncbi:MAG: glycosyltransferase family 4 protein [Desulfobacterota bacterium]|nr:glycosyltransferase family 4 protein [Thermodesulfobacteriota bacterium]
MKSRIGLFLISRGADGGVFQYSQAVLTAAAALPRDRFDVLGACGSHEWAQLAREHGIPTVPLRLGIWKYLSFRMVCRFLPISLWRKLAPSLNPIVHRISRCACDLWIFPAQDTWAYLLPVPSLGTIHDLMHRYEARFPEVSAHGEYGKREAHFRNTCRWTRAVLVDSQTGKRHVAESYGLNPSEIYVLPYVPPKIPPAGTAEDAANPAARLPRKYFLYPAQFWEHKNHKALVRAAALLTEEMPDLKVVFTGTPKNAYASTIDLIEKLKMKEHFEFLGYVPQIHMPELYRRARALIMPTFFGPTNIPPLEAAAVGCPAAVSDIYGMREQMGDGALYFNPSAPAEIAQVMQSLWQSDDASIEKFSKNSFFAPARMGRDIQHGRCNRTGMEY